MMTSVSETVESQKKQSRRGEREPWSRVWNFDQLPSTDKLNWSSAICVLRHKKSETEKFVVKIQVELEKGVKSENLIISVQEKI